MVIVAVGVGTEMNYSRQPGESTRWFTRFELFRLMGPDRSLFGAYKQYLVNLGKERSRPPTAPPNSWRNNSVKWEWWKRAEIWDMEEHQKLLVQAARDSAAMLERHRILGETLQAVGGARIAMIKRVERDGVEKIIPDMRLSEARHWIKDGIIVERTASGLPADVLEVRALSDNQLLARQRAAAAVLKPARDGDAEAGNDNPDDGDEPVPEVPEAVLE